METNNSARRTTAPELHLVCGSGGSRAILASAGAILACHLAGIKKWKSVGGISGGSIPTAMLQGGLSVLQLLHRAIEIDFASLLTRHARLWQIILAYFMKSRYEKTRPKRGVMSSEKMGRYMEQQARMAAGLSDTEELPWPKSYWTMAVAGTSNIVFTETGVWEVTKCGTVRQISDKPAPLGLAIQGSCAVPGIIDAVPYAGTYLFDGALGPEGRCPVSVAVQFFGANRSDIVACDVGEESGNSKHNDRIMRLWKILCGEDCVPQTSEGVSADGGLVVITPTVTNFRSLQFTLTRDQKWQAVMAGFMGAVPALENAGLLAGEDLTLAKGLVSEFQSIQALCEDADENCLADMTERMLARIGMY